MTKILGLDLGTNSIGWAIRDDDDFYDNQIIDKGVLVFKKGVGEGDSGEYSLAAERRSNRSKRRLYNAKRYRKWETLKVLIENNMCPLSQEELNLWRVGEWVNINNKAKNNGRIFPMSEGFLKWIRMDFNSDGKGDYISPYEIRIELTEKLDKADRNRLHKIGRVLYHLTQRRGFKTSRKSGKSKYGENEYFKKFYEAYPDRANWTASKIWMYLLSQGDENEALKIRRIRNSGIIPRDEYEKEFKDICEKQELGDELTKRLHEAIYYVRPLRTQKGLIGKCTLEKNKPRIPISHPYFEEFRALQFINNIKWREAGTKDNYEFVPIKIKRNIFENLFFRKSSPHFKFEEISNKFSEKGRYEFNFKNNPSISACPVITGIMRTFGDKWENIFIEDENEYGINWNRLSLSYETTQYGKDKHVKLDADGLWHILFDSLQTKDDENGLKIICDKFNWDAESIKEFTGINIQQGYASLSKNAIMKILPYLRNGVLYTDAVFLANIKKVLGNGLDKNIINSIKKDIEKASSENREQKDKLSILNSLVQQFFTERKHLQNKEAENIDHKMSIENKARRYFGDKYWYELTEDIRSEMIGYITIKYTMFINGKQEDKDKATNRNEKQNPIYDYYKIPRLDDAIKKILKEKYKVSEKHLKHLYHPSDIEMYPKAEAETSSIDGIEVTVRQLGNPQPPSNGFKNPMAMRTLHELRKLINYLLVKQKIDEETRIVVEIARELNDKNYRKAYMDWTKDKEKENNEYRNAIQQILGTNNEPSTDDYKKFACITEQIIEYELSQNMNEDFRDRYKGFINTYLTDNNDNPDLHTYIMHLILTRDEFAGMLNYSPANSNKWVTQIIRTSKQFRNKRKELKEMLTRYRLWNEQKFHCIYTGRIIPLNELFGANYQLEHTIPRSISFDSELKNLTVCDAIYNNQVKSNKFPTECPNYEIGVNLQTVKGRKNCPPIKNAVDKLIKPKVTELEKRIAGLRHAAKGIPDWETDKKDANIRLRHYLMFEAEYWKQKLFTFEVKKDEWRDKFKNSQLIDTQIISKYAKSYLKSLFGRVEVQKGNITALFREIYGLPGKSRDNHIHHAIDAAVLTLIPGSATRDALIENYFRLKENKTSNSEIPKPYDTFTVAHIKDDIENSLIVNHITKDQTLNPTRKFSRKRGKIEYLKNKENGKYLLDEKGRKKVKILEGDSIRGRLHKETYYGAIKVNKRDENGFPCKDETGNYITKQDNEGKDIHWVVVRNDITKLKIETENGIKTIKDFIIDPFIKQRIEYQLNNGKTLDNIFADEKEKNIIRHVRCRVPAGRGYLTYDKAIQIKKHVFCSKHEHKKTYYAQNSDNFAYLLYEGELKDKIKRGYRILNYFDIVNLEIKRPEDISKIHYFKNLEIGSDNNRFIMNLKYVIRKGTKMLLYNTEPGEILCCDRKELSKRLYVVYKLNEVSTTGYIYAQHHMESRSNDILGDGDTNFNSQNGYQARLKLRPDGCNFIVENKEFIFTLDGSIIFNTI